VTAHRRQRNAYMAWLTAYPAEHSEAFADVAGAEAAVTIWRRHLLRNPTDELDRDGLIPTLIIGIGLAELDGVVGADDGEVVGGEVGDDVIR
jgi:hypothetical protein